MQHDTKLAVQLEPIIMKLNALSNLIYGLMITISSEGSPDDNSMSDTAFFLQEEISQTIEDLKKIQREE